ncbi:steryl-sulfatase-like, partial [Saccoglossus kowalevskii]
IRSHSTTPFFLYMSHIKVHTPIFSSAHFRDKSKMGAFGDAILELDWSVGAVMALLKQLGIEKIHWLYWHRTMEPIPFDPFSRNPNSKDTVGSSGYVKNTKSEMVQLRGGKHSMYEGGIRVPAIVRWPETVTPGRETDAIVSLMDIFPTVTDILNHTVSNHVIDGQSLLPLLRDPRSAPPHEYLFHYCASALIPAMTYGKYKIHFVDQYTDNECYSTVVMPTPLIYNLDDDPGEQHPLSTSESADIQLLVKDILSEHESTTPNDLFTQLDTLMLPWLFPCSNFPFCHQELEEKEDFSDLNLI